MGKLKVMTLFGTRPEAIKMCPLIRKLYNCEAILPLCCVTAQHRQMLDSVLDIFKITPNFDLDIMETSQTLASITMKALSGLDELFKTHRPDLVLVHGDTTTAFAGALAAFYHKIPVGHVEAGLRTYDRYSPFPEEINRTLISDIAEFHFCPTEANEKALIKENIHGRIFITGNTVIDALFITVTPGYSFKSPVLQTLPYSSKRIITLTAHRRENYGIPFENIFTAIVNLAKKFPDVEFVYPVHMSPAVRDTANRILSGKPGIHLIEPVDVCEMHNLISRSYMVLTDSGGLQEEAPALGKPVLVLRRETERPEAVAAGTVKLAGIERGNIETLVSELLLSESEYTKMAKAVNPYGDGHACRRITEGILYSFGLNKTPPDSFIPR